MTLYSVQSTAFRLSFTCLNQWWVMGWKQTLSFLEKIIAASLYLFPYLLTVLFLLEPRTWRLLLPTGCNLKLVGWWWATPQEVKPEAILIGPSRSGDNSGRWGHTWPSGIHQEHQATCHQMVTEQNTVSPNLSSASPFGFMFSSLKRNK